MTSENTIAEDVNNLLAENRDQQIPDDQQYLTKAQVVSPPC